MKTLALSWRGSPWCSLLATDGRTVDLKFWNVWRGRAGDPPPGTINLETEVRLFAWVRIKNGEGAGGRRARWGLRVVREGFTAAKVRLYSLPLGGLLECAKQGVPLVLRPRGRYASAGGVIGSAELARLSVAVDVAQEAGEWVLTGKPRADDWVRQLEAF